MGIVVIAGIISVCAPVRAQEVTAKGAGTIGGAVAGAEVVVVVESILRVKPLWPYIVFPTLGAVGGGIGGYKLEQKTRGGAIALLITSMVGIIPTVIGAASARAFHPEDVGAKRGDRIMPTESLEIQRSGDMDTSTEVEEYPDGLPPGPLGPPAPSTQPGAGDTTIEISPGNDAENPPQSHLAPYREHQERIAHLSSGALLHMNRNRRVGLGIPAIDVFPLAVSTVQQPLHGVEVYVPLIAFDLP